MFPEPIRGKESVVEVNKRLLEAFPDLVLRVLDIASNGEVVALQYILAGTFQRALQTPQGSVAPTGHRFEVRTAEFDRVNSEGLICEAYVYFYDLSGLHQVLGPGRRQ